MKKMKNMKKQLGCFFDFLDFSDFSQKLLPKLLILTSLGLLQAFPSPSPSLAMLLILTSLGLPSGLPQSGHAFLQDPKWKAQIKEWKNQLGAIGSWYRLRIKEKTMQPLFKKNTRMKTKLNKKKEKKTEKMKNIKKK